MSASSARRLLPILAVQFVGTLGFSIVIPILVYLVRDLGGAAWTYGLAGATYSAFQFVGAPILGRWSDRIGRRRVLFVSQVGTLAGWLLFAFALSLHKIEIAHFAGASLTLPLLVIFLARAVDGATGGNVSVANAYVADLTSGEEKIRQRAFGWMGMAASLGFSIGPAIGGVLSATRFGYSAPVVVAVVISAVAAVMCLALPDVPVSEVAPASTSTLADLTEQRSSVQRLIIATFVLFLAFNVFYAIFPVRADATLHWTPSIMGVFFAVMSLALITSEGPVLDVASRRISPRALFVAGMVLLAIAFVCFTSTAASLTFVGGLLFALGNGLSWPTFQARIADAAGSKDQGVVQGSAASASSLASILGLIVAGVLYESLGRSLFVIAAILFLLLGFSANRLWSHTSK